MQELCGLQGIFDLFNCKTPENAASFPFANFSPEFHIFLLLLYQDYQD